LRSLATRCFYLLLPLHHETFGVSLAEAGLLLAANRLVRIAGYGWVARLYAERGPHAARLLAALGSLLSTLGYAALSGVWALLIARLIWGVSFARRAYCLAPNSGNKEEKRAARPHSSELP
jgi:MFS transporter, DHA1 family, inner membrane transport protein